MDVQIISSKNTFKIAASKKSIAEITSIVEKFEQVESFSTFGTEIIKIFLNTEDFDSGLEVVKALL